MNDTTAGGVVTATRTPAEIRADLNAIAPWPATGEVTAPGLARGYAVSAYGRQVIRRHRSEDGRARLARIGIMCAEFSAAVALAALADPMCPPLFGPEGFGATSPADLARTAATEIRDMLEDGEAVGDWLHAFLGREICERIGALTAELDEAIAAQRKPCGCSPAEVCATCGPAEGVTA